MQQIPHLDVVEGDIDPLLADPANFVLDAVECEDVNEWVPDLGMTEYPVRSIYRPAALATSGTATTLRHRFWDTLRGMRDHTGERYLGLVIYAAAGEECPFELRLGAEEIGRIEPTRHDNRRHLIVADRRIAFGGLMEVLQVTAPGPGTYRIESIVLLARLPRPSSFVPVLERLSATMEADGGRLGIAIDFITRHPASVTVTARELDSAAGERGVADRSARKLHHLRIDGLRPNARYGLQITATGQGGEVATGAVEVVADPGTVARGAARVPLKLVPATAGAAPAPLTFGVPLPRGRLHGSATGCLELASGTAIPIQTRILSRWEDGSSRWLLVDAALPGEARPPAAPEAATLVLSAAARVEKRRAPAAESLVAEGPRLRIRVDPTTAPGTPDGAIPLRIEVRRGAAWQPLGRGPAQLQVVLGDGTPLVNGPLHDLALEESGPQRSVLRIRVAHLDAAGTPHLRSTLRLHLYREPFQIKLVHRLEVVSRALPHAAGGTIEELGADQELLRANLAGSDGEQATLLALRSATLTLPLAAPSEVRLGGECFDLAAGSLRLLHEHAQGYTVVQAGRRSEREGRSNGHLVATAAAGVLGIGVRRFWETGPNAIAVTDAALTFELLPALSGGELPGDAEAWHRLYSWHRDGRYLLKAGMAVTREAVLVLAADHAAAGELLAVFERPPLARPALAWFNASDVWGELAAKTDSPFPRYERMIDHAYGEWLKEREQWQQYGFHNFGDYYGEMGWAWGNNEYDPPYAHLLEFLRGGQRGWAELAEQACRHLVDVDTINHSRAAGEVGAQYAHMAGHCGGYLPPYFRYKMKGSTLIPSHMWVEGAVLQYCLSGDENLRETLLRTGEWLLGGGMEESGGGIDRYDFRTCREAGWHLIHLTGMARLADDRRFLNAAFLILERVLQRQEPDGGWMRNLKAGHCGCPIPRHRGEASFMVGIMMNGLRRLHQLTGDWRAADAIVGAARWLLSRTWDTGQRLFRYTPCPNLGAHGAAVGNTQQVVEGLGYAWRLTRDDAVADTILAALPHLAQPRLASTPEQVSGIGNRLCSETRSMPAFLADTEDLLRREAAAAATT